MRFFCIYRMTSIDWEVQQLLLTITIMDPVSPLPLSYTHSPLRVLVLLQPLLTAYLTYLLPATAAPLPQTRVSYNFLFLSLVEYQTTQTASGHRDLIWRDIWRDRVWLARPDLSPRNLQCKKIMHPTSLLGHFCL